MFLRYLNILAAVFLTGTAVLFNIFFNPYDNGKSEDVVNTEIYVVSEPESQIEVNPLTELLTFTQGTTVQLPFSLLNRDLPARWYSKGINIKYTYLGEYTDNTVTELNDLLNSEYRWQKQLDADKNILLGGPIFLMDNVYQLHTHNGLSLANRHYLFGDLLHFLYNKEELKGTQIKIGGVVLESVWTKDTRILQDNTTPGGADLIISTCLERNGDRRLISGWVVINQ